MTFSSHRLAGRGSRGPQAGSLGIPIAALSLFLMACATQASPTSVGRIVLDRHLVQLAQSGIISGQNAPQMPVAGAPVGKLPSDTPRKIGSDEAVASRGMPDQAPTPDPGMDAVNQYLWEVYERTPVKRDGSGDFTWKDAAAAARLGVTVGDYVIVGMDRDFRELLYRAGLAMDAAGFRWTILSGFRDDYRQGLASGYKAIIGDSLHGGSVTTGGYGHGCAVDIRDAGGDPQMLRAWIDANSAALNLERPLPRIDPGHIQARGAWHEVAAALRHDRLAADNPSENSAASSEPVDLGTALPSEADLLCIGLHHHRPDPLQADAPERQNVKVVARAHPTGKLPARADALSTENHRSTAGHVPPAEFMPQGKTAAHAAETARSPQHNSKGTVRSLSPHAAPPVPRSAGTT
jgi:hypothetical protein